MVPKADLVSTTPPFIDDDLTNFFRDFERSAPRIWAKFVDRLGDAFPTRPRDRPLPRRGDAPP
jgi:hypothetical protein